jgi:hypothetical protein
MPRVRCNLFDADALVMKLKNLFYLIHRDWIIGHGSNALSVRIRLNKSNLQSGGQLVGIPKFDRGQLPGIFSPAEIPGGQLAGILVKLQGSTCRNRGSIRNGMGVKGDRNSY